MFQVFPEWLTTGADLFDALDALARALEAPGVRARLARSLGSRGQAERLDCARALIRLALRARGCTKEQANNFFKGDNIRAYKQRRREARERSRVRGK